MSTVILLSPFIIPIIGSSADSNNVDVLAEKKDDVQKNRKLMKETEEKGKNKHKEFGQNKKSGESKHNC